MVSLDSEGEGGGDIVLCKYIIMYKNTLTIYVRNTCRMKRLSCIKLVSLSPQLAASDGVASLSLKA